MSAVIKGIRSNNLENLTNPQFARLNAFHFNLFSHKGIFHILPTRCTSAHSLAWVVFPQLLGGQVFLGGKENATVFSEQVPGPESSAGSKWSEISPKVFALFVHFPNH